MRAVTTLLIGTAAIAPAAAQPPHPQVTFIDGRLALSFDGNADPDDIGAIAAATAMIAAAGLEDRLVHTHYLSQVWAKNVRETTVHSAEEAIDRFAFRGEDFYNALLSFGTQGPSLNPQTQSLLAAMNASTADDPLTVIVGGPFETVYQAAVLSDPAVRPHVNIVSHSSINDQNDGPDGGFRTRVDVEALGFAVTDIRDQNRGLSTGKDFAPWAALQNHPNPDARWVYERMVASGKADISDAGMTYFALTGDENGDVAKLASFFNTDRSSPAEPIGPRPGLVAVEAESGTPGPGFAMTPDASASGGQVLVAVENGSNNRPNDPENVVTYTVTFDEPGYYELYGLVATGPNGAADDSFFLPLGFGTKDPDANDDWQRVDNLDDESGGELVWINLTAEAGDTADTFDNAFFVPPGELTQTLQLGSRQNRVILDTFVFVRNGLTYSDAELDLAAGIPEPSGATLTLAGLAALGARSRRR